MKIAPLTLPKSATWGWCSRLSNQAAEQRRLPGDSIPIVIAERVREPRDVAYLVLVVGPGQPVTEEFNLLLGEAGIRRVFVEIVAEGHLLSRNLLP